MVEWAARISGARPGDGPRTGRQRPDRDSPRRARHAPRPMRTPTTISSSDTGSLWGRTGCGSSTTCAARRRGRLSEVLGPDGLETDIIARTVGINRIAAEEVHRIPAETRRRLHAFSHGINAAMEESRDSLPIEFDLLDYEPEPWSPDDSIAVWAEFRWYLTGRLPVIALPEIARRALGDGPLYQAFPARRGRGRKHRTARTLPLGDVGRREGRRRGQRP